MSVRTTADEQCDEAQEHLQYAVSALSKVTIERVWGYEDFNESYRARLRKAMDLLMEARDLLDGRNP